MPYIVGTATQFPPYYYPQAEVMAMLRHFWQQGYSNTERLERIHRNMMIDGRYLSLPLDAYREQAGFGATNDTWIQVATDLAESTLCSLLGEAQLEPAQISQLVTTTVTGVAVPSLDARLMNRIPFAHHLKRVPLFGLGCAGGAAGVARLADYLRGHPREAAILLAVELCSLTFQPDDLSLANVVASGLFGDGAAAVLMVGDEHPLARPGRPRVVASRACFFPDTEAIMGWDVGETGFKVVLNAAIPDLVRRRLRPTVAAFLAEHQLSVAGISQWIVHPGGPKVIEALEAALGLDGDVLDITRQSLARVGNVSSASVLLILDELLAQRRPLPGEYGLMMAMGPAFGAELVLLQW